jgi:predicted ATPase/class 3 adenylate cyclase
MAASSDVHPCPACGHSNRAQARFCEECGQPLDRRCSQCGTELRPQARFCDECGAAVAGAPKASAPAPAPEVATRRDPRAYTPKHLAERILTSRSALEGERKQVTVLFADVTGSMELAEQVDPEEWHRILDRFFEILTEGVHRFEGTINQYTGDGVMALFGAPIAHEDHPHRACWAALHLKDEVNRFAQELKRERGLTFAMRVGLNSGEVVVGKIGDDLRMDYTAQGHVVGLAARLQALADPGKVYVSKHTEALVSGYFALESLGAFKLKGVSEPIGVFSLEGAGRMRTRLDVSRSRGLSRFVGRADEMATLQGALGRAAEGRGQVVGVVADAGTGKSRLCSELVELCRARSIAVHQGIGVAHGKLLPFLPILEMLRSVFAIDDRDGPREARQKIAGTLVLVDPRFEEALPLIFDFLGVADPERPAPLADPADRQRQIFAVFARLFRALGEREPHVVLLEDLHWFDDGSGTFVESLVEAVAGTKILLLLNYRPEFRARWMEKPSTLQLPLLPLGPSAIVELLDDLLGHDASLEGLHQLVRERTGGNPFFVEEVVQSLIDAGSLEGVRGAYRLVRALGDLRVPPTVHALLAARIDRLAERERRLLQTAAVIGKQFPESILKRVAGLADADLADALRTLKARDLVFEESLFPEVEYAFKHPLTQEVAYGSQLADRRRLAHAAVARLLEEQEAVKLDEQAPLLAHHWESAGEVVAAARWHRRAAEKLESTAPRGATAHWRAVRRLGADAGDSGEGRVHRLAACLGLVRAADYDLVDDAEGASAFEEGRRLALDVGDVASRVRLLIAYSALVLNERNFQRSAELLAEAESAVGGLDDPELKFVVRAHGAYAAVVRGAQLEALARYDEAFVLLRGRIPKDSFGLRRYLGALANQSMIVAEAGRLDDAERLVERFRTIAADARDLAYECIGHFSLSRIAMYRGLPGDALTHLPGAIETAERLGARGFRATARMAIGAAHVARGSYEEAIAALEEGRDMGSPEIVGPTQWIQLLARLAEAHLGRAENEQALAVSAEAVARAEGVQRLACVEAYLSRARVLLAAAPDTDPAEIERLLESATTVARHCGAKIYEPSILEERARLARSLGRTSESQGLLREALRLYAEMHARGHAKRLATALGEDAIEAAGPQSP